MSRYLERGKLIRRAAEAVGTAALMAVTSCAASPTGEPMRNGNIYSCTSTPADQADSSVANTFYSCPNLVVDVTSVIFTVNRNGKNYDGRLNSQHSGTLYIPAIPGNPADIVSISDFTDINDMSIAANVTEQLAPKTHN